MHRDGKPHRLKNLIALVIAWGLTLIPLLWGVLSTAKKAAMLFR